MRGGCVESRIVSRARNAPPQAASIPPRRSAGVASAAIAGFVTAQTGLPIALKPLLRGRWRFGDAGMQFAGPGGAGEVGGDPRVKRVAKPFAGAQPDRVAAGVGMSTHAGGAGLRVCRSRL